MGRRSSHHRTRNSTESLTPLKLNWTLVAKSPNAITYETQRFVTLPCKEKPRAFAAYCLAARPVTRGLAWRFSVTNVGHAAQHLFKCWSFFMEHESYDRFIYDTLAVTSEVDSHAFKRNKFARMMVEAMHAKVILFYNTTELPRYCGVEWKVPTRLYYPGWGESFFNRPQAAWKLTAAVLQTSLVLPQGLLAGESAQQETGLKVGVLGRGKSSTGEDRRRHWPHAIDFVEMVRRQGSSLGVANASEFVLDGLSLREQALAIRQQDVIITTHGSHSVSLAFLKRCSVVVEILAERYMVTLFSQLATEVGARVFLMHSGTSALSAANRTGDAQLSIAHSSAARNGGRFDTLSAERVFSALPIALRARAACLRGGDDDFPVPYDGIPTLGGMSAFKSSLQQDSRHCFECVTARASCCDSREAISEYADSGFACNHCMERYARWTKSDACAKASRLIGREIRENACRVNDGLGAKGILSGTRYF